MTHLRNITSPPAARVISASRLVANQTRAAAGPGVKLLLPAAIQPDSRFGAAGFARMMRSYDLGTPPPALPADSGGHQVQRLPVSAAVDYVVDRTVAVYGREVVLRRGLVALLSWLDQFPGQTWEERWLASGADAAPITWRPLVPGQQSEISVATSAAIVARVLRPSYGWQLEAKAGAHLPARMLGLNDPDGFERLRGLPQYGRALLRHQYDAEACLSRVVIRTGGFSRLIQLRLSLSSGSTGERGRSLLVSSGSTWGLARGRMACLGGEGALEVPVLSRVELYAAIRRDSRAGKSSRAIEHEYGVGRKTVRQALASAWPAPRKLPTPRSSKLDPFKPVIDEILRVDLTAPRKQRHTVTRIVDRLISEHAMTDVSYQVVRAYVAQRHVEILAESGRGPDTAFLPQTHRPGAEAEVDFGDVAVRIRGEQVTCYLFSFRLSFSGKAVHRISVSCGQEAFFEGHAHALSVLGGVPTGKVRYDNLKAAVAKVLGLSRARIETDRWIAFRSHYGLESWYCRPGLIGAHEKGGVEGQIGWFRRNHLVPIPEVDSIGELNALVEQWDRDDDQRRIGTRPHTIGEHFAAERPMLAPLPVEVFETGRLFTPRVDRYSQVTVRTNRYSVPTRFIGRELRVMLHASHLVIYDGRAEIARHDRLHAKGGSRLELDHYLEALVRKPGALPGATVLEQARAAGKFTPIHDAWWAAACKAHGDTAGTRALIEVLLLHRHMPHDQVVAGLATALRVSALTADAVDLEARKAAEVDETLTTTSLSPSDQSKKTATIPKVTSLTQRRLAQLPPDTRELPSVEIYDQLLPSRQNRTPSP